MGKFKIFLEASQSPNVKIKTIKEGNYTITSLLKLLNKQNNIPSVEYVSMKSSDIPYPIISGEYDPEIDEDNDMDDSEPCIFVYLIYSDDKFTLDKEQATFLNTEIPKTIKHEMIHMQQYRKRYFETQPNNYKGSDDKKYLAHKDEIEAFAHDISQELSNLSTKDAIKTIKNFDVSKSDTLKRYSIFDKNDKVIKKLIKRAIYYIEMKD